MAPTLTTFDVSPTGNGYSKSALDRSRFLYQPRARLDCIWLVRSHHQALGSLPFVAGATRTAHHDLLPSGNIWFQGVDIRTRSRLTGAYGCFGGSRACYSHVGSSCREANWETRWAYRQYSRDSYIRRFKMRALQRPLSPFSALISDSPFQLLTASADGRSYYLTPCRLTD